MSKTILIIDDTPANLELLTGFLSDEGFDIRVAEDGETALEQVDTARPDIILLDVMMPGIDGFETCRRLKRGAAAEIPVLFMTALADTAHKLQGFECGAVDYVTKPIQQEELLARVQAHLTLADLQQRLAAQNEIKSRFMNLVAGELLQSIDEFSEHLPQLNAAGDDDLMYDDLVRTIESCALRVRHVVEDSLKTGAAAGARDGQEQTKAYVLLVDDTPANLQTLTDFLATEGFEIRVAESGESALEQIGFERPDLVLLDVMMPGIDGFETLQRLKKQSATSRIPVLMMTALAETADKVKAFRGGAVDYVTKPIQQEELLARVRTHLRIRQMQAQLEQESAGKDQLMQIAAYEFRTPLSSLAVAVEMLRDSALGAPAREKCPDVVQNFSASVWRTHAELTQFLEYRLRMAGTLPLSLTTLDLKALTLEALAEARHLARLRGVLLSAELPDELPPALGDEKSLRQVMDDLISTAVKLCRPMRRIVLRISAEQDLLRWVAEYESASGEPSDFASLLVEKLISGQGGDWGHDADGVQRHTWFRLPAAAVAANFSRQ